MATASDKDSQAQAELDAAAGALETRARLLRIQTKRLMPEAWEKLAPHLKNFVPLWLRDMLARFSLYGVALEYRDRSEPFVRSFSFAGPDDYNATLSKENQ